MHPPKNLYSQRVAKLFTKLIYPFGNAYFLQGAHTFRFVGNPYGLHSTRRKISFFAFALVVLAHLGVAVAFRSQPHLEVAETQPKPIMLSLVSEQPSVKNTPSLSNSPEQVHQKPVKPKAKAIKPKKAPIKPVESIKPIEKQVVEQEQNTQTLASERTSTSPAKVEPASDAAAHTQSKSKPNNAEMSYQAPSFNAGYLHNPPPSYPPVSRRMGEQGRVLLRVTISADGMALSVAMQSGSGSNRLDEAAVAAVRKWRFVPAKRGGQAVSASVMVPIKFSLEG